MAGIYDEDTFFTNYANMERSQGLEHAGEWKQLQTLFPDVSNQRVLDLGCGMGWHARYFVDHGARFVLALDLSENMLAKARALHRSPKIEYRQADLSSFSIEGSFDFVFANLCLHYLDDLSTLFRQVYATLEKGGVFLFNIEHPVFTAGDQQWIGEDTNHPVWKVDAYFQEGARKTRFLDCEVVKYHHTLTTLLNGLLQTGFTLEAVEEVVPSSKLLDPKTYALEMRRPMMLLVKARK